MSKITIITIDSEPKYIFFLSITTSRDSKPLSLNSHGYVLRLSDGCAESEPPELRGAPSAVAGVERHHF
jgi:hypothetical protein